MGATNNTYKHLHTTTPIALMFIVLYLIYPYYQYYIDPDGTAYLTISQRYADGDYNKAVNGYWSPWSCWLTAILIKAGLHAIPASVIINSMGAACFLSVSASLFGRFNLTDFQKWTFNTTLSLFLCYAVFYQSFDDLWECFFLLLSLRIMLSDSYSGNYRLWLLNGLLGAFAYFAKAYAFPFFLLNTAVCNYILFKDNSSHWIKPTLVAAITMCGISFPWILLLHDKYGIWTTSTAGGLNMSWYLVGHPYWKDGIEILIPPTYRDSPYYWEDPYTANGSTPHFWSSWQLFGRQLLKIGHNLYKLLISTLLLSVFFPLAGLIAIRQVRKIFTNQQADRKTNALCASLLLFPCGYILINFESRYIWYLLPGAIVVLALFTRQSKHQILQSRTFNLLLAASLLAYPIVQSVKMCNNGKAEFLFAERLKSAGITSKSMISNLHPRVLSKVAYFSGNQFYANILQLPKDAQQPNRSSNSAALLEECRKYGVDYYLYASPANQMLRSPNYSQLFNEALGNLTQSIVMASADSSLLLYDLRVYYK